MTHVVESVRSITAPTLTEVEKDRVTRTMPVAFTPAVLVTAAYAGGGLAAGSAVVGAYELGRAAAAS
ncbi:hypothetical protein [Streptomyces prasinus]